MREGRMLQYVRKLIDRHPLAIHPTLAFSRGKIAVIAT